MKAYPRTKVDGWYVYESETTSPRILVRFNGEPRWYELTTDDAEKLGTMLIKGGARKRYWWRFARRAA